MTADVGTAVRVPVATLWTGPDAPRDVDAPALADEPDVAAWTTSLSAQERLGLHGRVLTQLLRGEPVAVTAERGAWVEVVAPWQPSSLDPRGYPGWVRRAHLGRSTADRGAAPLRRADNPLDTARQFLGLEYLWGGMCEVAVDCSGLVHWVFRAHGQRVPRDAHDQHRAATPVRLGEERPGDLYFFVRPGRAVHHVGFVVAPGVMLHAPETGRFVTEEPLDEDRRQTLVSAGRFPST